MILAGVLLAAFVLGRLTRRAVPSVVAFLSAGAVAGPGGVGLIGGGDLAGLRPVTLFVMAALMCAIGERISPADLRTSRAAVGPAVAGSMCAALLVGGATLAAGAGWPLALILAALGAGGAPITMSAIVRAGGTETPFARRVVAGHVISDLCAAGLFACSYPVAVYLGGDTSFAESCTRFARLGIGAAVVGIAGGVVAGLIANRSRRRYLSSTVLGVELAALVAATSTVRMSLPLAALALGASMAATATADARRRLAAETDPMLEPLGLLFFTMAGATIRLDLLPQLGTIGGAYIGARSAAKLIGVRAAALRRTLPIRQANDLAIAALPQAGAAVALAMFADTRLPGLCIPPIVLGSVIVFEGLGCALAAWVLRAHQPPTQLSRRPHRLAPLPLPESARP